jgi:hypothetical protein
MHFLGVDPHALSRSRSTCTAQAYIHSEGPTSMFCLKTTDEIPRPKKILIHLFSWLRPGKG